MPKPMPQTGARLKAALDTQSLTVYLNREAILSLINILEYISKSDPTENYETHVFIDIDPNRQRKNKIVNLDESLIELFRDLNKNKLENAKIEHGQNDLKLSPFELTLMQVPDSIFDC
jgi:hypothetical protein